MAKVGFGWSSESFLEQVKEQLSDGVVVAYDENSKKVISRRQISWKGLVLESHPHQASQEEKQHCFWEVVQQLDGFDELPLSPDAFSWWKRYVCYLHWEESLPLEALEGVKASIFSNMKAWLLPYLAGIFSWEAFEKLDWFHAIQGAVQPEIHRCMDQKYPGKLKVPSGSELPLDYGDPMEPILAVRIQEVFGLLKTPVIAGGKVKLLLHLLSPARRPVQITTDLESFWDKGYFEVKKELKRRYPKHDWPDNPLQAQPKRGIKRRAD
jgi:ATP-dependent helicase HrpB